MGGQEFKFALERPRNQIQARHIQTGSDKWMTNQEGSQGLTSPNL